MQTVDYLHLAAQAAADKKAENIRILEVRELCSFTDYFLICSAFTDRQVRAIADHIDSVLAEKKVYRSSAEGLRDGRWVLMDYGNFVIHIFQDALREYYDLESIWDRAPRVPLPPELFAPAASEIHSPVR